MPLRLVPACALTALILCSSSPGVAQPPEGKKKGNAPKAKTWDEVADSAVAYLKTTQAEDGSWSKTVSPGITGVVLTGLFTSGKANAADPMVAKALKFVETMVDPADGSIAGKERHKFYMTSVNLSALKLSGSKGYDATVNAAADYLKKTQVGSADGKGEDDPNFGGFGYGPGTRGDLSNTQFALDALTLAGTPKDDPVYKRAAVFVSRCQNLKSEANGQPWADKINDGSFIYVLPQAGGKGDPADPRPGYGSMTFAGIKSLTRCGVAPGDARVKKALDWVAKNYSLDVNPGRQEGAGGQGYYYYLVAMARTLDLLGVEEFADAAGKKHEWRAEILRALANRQRPNGSWGNDFSTWMESNSDLDAAYALIALGHAKPKAK